MRVAVDKIEHPMLRRMTEAVDSVPRFMEIAIKSKPKRLMIVVIAHLFLCIDSNFVFIYEPPF